MATAFPVSMTLPPPIAAITSARCSRAAAAPARASPMVGSPATGNTLAGRPSPASSPACRPGLAPVHTRTPGAEPREYLRQLGRPASTGQDAPGRGEVELHLLILP